MSDRKRIEALELALENALRCSAKGLCGSCRENAVKLLRQTQTPGTIKRRKALKS
jgi:hypothetical protein